MTEGTIVNQNHRTFIEQRCNKHKYKVIAQLLFNTKWEMLRYIIAWRSYIRWDDDDDDDVRFIVDQYFVVDQYFIVDQYFVVDKYFVVDQYAYLI